MSVTQSDLLEQEKRVEVAYTKGKLFKRMIAFFIDFFIITLTTFILFAGLNVAFKNADFYKNASKTMLDLELASGLYIDVNGVETDISSYVDSDEIKGVENKKNYISNALTHFYQDSLFFSDNKEYKNYQDRKLSYKVDDKNIFEKVDDVVVEKSTVNPENYLSFYQNEFNNHAVGFLVGNVNYATAQKTVFLTVLGLLISSLFVSYTIYVLILPLTCFKRGRQTIGMKINQLGYINVNATNVTTGKYIGRFFFSFFFYFILNFVGFLIPSIVTMSMMFISKTNQTLTEYLFNDYVVSVENQDVYLDYLEYLDRQNKVSITTIETNSRSLY